MLAEQQKIIEQQAAENRSLRANSRVGVLQVAELTSQNAQLKHLVEQFRSGQNGLGLMELTPAEVGAIRKAIARLHHPDTGGDAERLKQWNAMLDPLES